MMDWDERERKTKQNKKTLIQSLFNTFHSSESPRSTDVWPWRDSAFLTSCSFPHRHLIRAGGDLRWVTNETHRKSNACRTTTQLPMCPWGSPASIWLHLGQGTVPLGVTWGLWCSCYLKDSHQTETQPGWPELKYRGVCTCLITWQIPTLSGERLTGGKEVHAPDAKLKDPSKACDGDLPSLNTRVACFPSFSYLSVSEGRQQAIGYGVGNLPIYSRCTSFRYPARPRPVDTNCCSPVGEAS